jgi:polar amino acid transport system permease protein
MDCGPRDHREILVTDLKLVIDYLPVLLAGAITTLQLASAALVGGTILGFFVGLMRSSRLRWLRWPATAYVELFRSVPILLQLFFVYFALPLLLRIDVPNYAAAVTALSLYSSSYMAEVVRTGVESVAHGQWEASYSLGMRYPAVLRFIIVPQAIRVAVPPAIGVYVFTVKDSSLASIIGYLELTGAGLAIRETGFGQGTLGVLLAVAAMYFVLAYSLSLGGRYLERRIRI